MSGPCMCGGPCCSSCGSPAQCEYEAAFEQATDILAEAKLTAEELLFAAKIGAQIAIEARSHVAAGIKQAKDIEAENAALESTYQCDPMFNERGYP